MTTAAAQQTELPFPLLRRGKVREMYDLGDEILMVASDRISAHDFILHPPVPDKGAVLTQMSRFWFEKADAADLTQHHCISADPDEVVRLRPELEDTRERWAGRGMLVRRAEPFPVECVVRGYVAGSAWREYRKSGTLAGEPLPEGLVEAQELAEPIFSPATKAEEGHDENITFSAVEEMLGAELADHLRDTSIALYRFARDLARERGIIIADTKFEFGSAVASGGRAGSGAGSAGGGGDSRVSPQAVLWIDEALTPDSSRFWPADEYEPGRTASSLDKQPVRDWLDDAAARGEWDGQSRPPELPEEVVRATTERYRDAFRRITGHELPDYGRSAGVS